jgi:hypothetical protein
MRSFVIAAVAALAFASAADAKQCRDASGKFMKCPPAPTAHQCTTGVPCGDTCIAKGKVCHKP